MLAGGPRVLANVVDEARRSALHYAAGKGSAEVVELLCRAGAALDLTDKEGEARGGGREERDGREGPNPRARACPGCGVGGPSARARCRTRGGRGGVDAAEENPGPHSPPGLCDGAGALQKMARVAAFFGRAALLPGKSVRIC